MVGMKKIVVEKKGKVSKNISTDIDKGYLNFFYRLKNSFLLIKNNKLWFTLLSFSTLFYLSIFVFLLYYFTMIIFEHQQIVLDYLTTISEADIIAGNLGPDPLAVYNHMQLWKQSFYMLIFWLSITILFIGGALWGIVNQMKKKIKFTRFLLNYFATQFIYFIPFIAIFYFSFNQYFEAAMGGESNQYITFFSWIGLFVVSYIYYISLGLTTNSTTLKELFKKTFKLSIKPLITFPTYVLALSLIVGISYLIYFFNEVYDNFYLLGFSLLIFIFALAYVKLLFAEEFY